MSKHWVPEGLMQNDAAAIGPAGSHDGAAAATHDQISAIVYRNIDEVVYQVQVEGDGRFMRWRCHSTSATSTFT